MTFGELEKRNKKKNKKKNNKKYPYHVKGGDRCVSQ